MQSLISKQINSKPDCILLLNALFPVLNVLILMLIKPQLLSQ